MSQAATPVGGHVSTRGGIANAVDNALAIGAEVLQMHPTSAQQWRRMHLDPDVLADYRERYARSGLRGHWLHALYLVNLATNRPELLRQSIESVVHHMEIAALLGADGVVLHPGSHVGAGFEVRLAQIAGALREVVERSAGSGPLLLVENSAGSGGCVGCSFEEVGRILDACGSDRVRACLDTQHMFASGYDFRDAEQLGATLRRFDADVGFERLALLHLNDSRTALGSNADRHANIGEGEIGSEGFRLLLAEPRLRRVPWVLEVPGEERRGPDVANLERVRRLAGLPSRSPAATAEMAQGGGG